MMNGMTSTCGRRLRFRLTCAMIAAMAITANPFVTSAGQATFVETVSDAAVEITPRPARVKPVSVRAYVQERASRHGWSWQQWRAVVALVNLENRQWNVEAKNREGSSAYGLFQILRTPHGTPLREQVDRFIRYIVERYDGDPVKALTHHRRHGWY